MSETAFGRLFRRTAAGNFQRHFGTRITYYPSDGSAGREISGRIERGTLEIITETGDVASQAIIVTVRNQTCKGIHSSEVDTGGDEILVALRVGGTEHRRTLTKVLSDHDGQLRVLCQ